MEFAGTVIKLFKCMTLAYPASNKAIEDSRLCPSAALT